MYLDQINIGDGSTENNSSYRRITGDTANRLSRIVTLDGQITGAMEDLERTPTIEESRIKAKDHVKELRERNRKRVTEIKPKETPIIEKPEIEVNSNVKEAETKIKSDGVDNGNDLAEKIRRLRKIMQERQNT